MAFNPLSVSQDNSDDDFYTVIDRLKRQNALSQDSFIRDIPFFTFPSISKESQVKELFQGSWDQNLYKILMKNIIEMSEDNQEDSSSTSSSAPNMMTFAQLCLYKVLPCPDPACSNRAREIVTHNQYKDYEFECPFYHHEKDRRRIVITRIVDEEFAYKANYYEEGRSNDEREKYSLNYFESMFHPLYYKMFRCKREHCNSCHFCPFYHQDQEKKAWDSVFSSFIKKDRITYVKDKQKYYESTHQTSHSGEHKSSGDQSPNKPYGKNYRNQRNNRYQKSPTTPPQYRNPNSPTQYPSKREGSGQYSNGKYGEWSNTSSGVRKNSDDSSSWNKNSFGVFNNHQAMAYRAC